MISPQLYKHKVEFNERVLSLHRRKREALAAVSSALGRAGELQSQLPTSLHVQLPSRPELAPEESPEAAFEVST